MSPPHWSTSQELRRNQQGARVLYYAHVSTSILEHIALVAGLCDGRRGACAKSAKADQPQTLLNHHPVKG
jgi:hypothetical protein